MIQTPEEQKRDHQKLADENWVLGVSSPWVEGYRIAGTTEIIVDLIEYQVQLLEYTSTGFMGTEKVSINVKKQGEKWLVDKYTPVKFDTVMDLWSEKLSEDTVKGLLAEAQLRFWYVATGGNGKEGVVRFQPAGEDRTYRWLGTDIRTKEKLTAYLQEFIQVRL